jgi:AcrR family transcriptional regulator
LYIRLDSATEAKASHRDRLLDAAQRCLHDRGYARTTARDLVAASDTNLASIGYHFGSKEALLNEAIAEAFRTWAAEVEGAVFGIEGGNLLDRIERSLAATLRRFEELRPFLVAFVEAFPQAVRFPELRERLAIAYEDVRRATGQMLERALEAQGAELAPQQRRSFASVLVAVCDGLMLQWLIDPERTPQASEVTASVRALATLLDSTR